VRVEREGRSSWDHPRCAAPASAHRSGLRFRRDRRRRPVVHDAVHPLGAM